MNAFSGEARPTFRSRFGRLALLAGGVTLALAMLILLALPALSEIAGLRDPVHGGTARWRWPWAGGIQKKQNRLHVTSLQDLRNTVFFDPVTRKPAAWYTITDDGRVQLFDAGGWNAEIATLLKPVTPAVVQQLERRFRTLEQERSAEEERRAATARADAEIARVRTLLKSQANAQPKLVEEARTKTNIEQPGGARADAFRGDSSRFERERVTGFARLGDDGPDFPAYRDDYRDRATRYNALVSAARRLIDAGRLAEARDQAQRAIQIDPSRMAARTLWAEAQTRIDDREPPRYGVRPSLRAPY